MGMEHGNPAYVDPLKPPEEELPKEEPPKEELPKEEPPKEEPPEEEPLTLAEEEAPAGGPRGARGGGSACGGARRADRDSVG